MIDSRQIKRYLREIDDYTLALHLEDNDINARLAAQAYLNDLENEIKDLNLRLCTIRRLLLKMIKPRRFNVP